MFTRHIQHGGGRHFEKTVKSPYLCNRLTDFDEIWHADVDWPPTGGISLKFSIFQKPRWRRQPSVKITKIAISRHRIGRSLRNKTDRGFGGAAYQEAAYAADRYAASLI